MRRAVVPVALRWAVDAGTSPTAVATIYNDGGVLNTAYAPPPTATIVVADTTLSIGETSLVTITFSEAVTGLTNADLTIANGTLSAVKQRRWRHHLDGDVHADRQSFRYTNVITLDNTGVINGLGTPASVPPTPITTSSTPCARPPASWSPTRP